VQRPGPGARRRRRRLWRGADAAQAGPSLARQRTAGASFSKERAFAARLLPLLEAGHAGALGMRRLRRLAAPGAARLNSSLGRLWRRFEKASRARQALFTPGVKRRFYSRCHVLPLQPARPVPRPSTTTPETSHDLAANLR